MFLGQEYDFDRLVKKIRLRDGSMSSKKEAEFKDELGAASSVGRKERNKGRVVGPILSHQVKSLIGDGNQAYVDNDLARAIDIMQEVIRIEPRASAAWTVVAQCYEDMNESQKALQLRIMVAHLGHDPKEWDRLARESKYESVLRELHTILFEFSDLSTCATLLQDALTHSNTIYPSGQGKGNASGLVIPAGGFSQIDLPLLADLYNVLGQHERAIETIRRYSVAPWKGGPKALGSLIGRPVLASAKEALYKPEILAWIQMRVTGPQLPGFKWVMIKIVDVEEGKLHANALLSEDIPDYSVLFAEIADAYYEREMYAEGKPIDELLGGGPAFSIRFLIKRVKD
ncbi:hypothetical protein BYT27DRAFT_7214631 [Phlegmacium glaucopus]|nr:hypothetical protein BYT27DRAFT_7214631 [Phlegmacium glaucopus]